MLSLGRGGLSVYVVQLAVPLSTNTLGRVVSGILVLESCPTCHGKLHVRISFHIKCYRTIRQRRADITIEDLSSLFLCTNLELEPCPSPQSVELLTASVLAPSTLEELGSNEAFLFFRRAPDLVQHRIRFFLQPWLEMVALGQTPCLIDCIRSLHAPTDAMIYTNLKAPLYLITIEFQGRSYISQIGHTRPTGGELNLYTPHNDQIHFWGDHFGVRGISADTSQIPTTPPGKEYFFGRVDLHNSTPDKRIIGHRNIS